MPSPNLAFWQSLVAHARSTGSLDDPVVREKFVRFYELIEVSRLSGQRARAKDASPVSPNLGKLMMSELYRVAADLGATVLGPAATLDSERGSFESRVQELMLFAPGPAIYGGTDQIQQNIIGERGLGLPREPGPAKDTPFSELPKN